MSNIFQKFLQNPLCPATINECRATTLKSSKMPGPTVLALAFVFARVRWSSAEFSGLACQKLLPPQHWQTPHMFSIIRLSCAANPNGGLARGGDHFARLERWRAAAPGRSYRATKGAAMPGNLSGFLHCRSGREHTAPARAPYSSVDLA